MGGISFKVPGRILKNQITLKATALTNTGVNGSIFCNTMKALEVIKHCGAKIRWLKEPIPVIDYASRPGQAITYGIKLNLELDGVIYPNTFMLIIDYRKHDLLVGFQFFTQY